MEKTVLDSIDSARLVRENSGNDFVAVSVIRGLGLPADVLVSMGLLFKAIEFGLPVYYTPRAAFHKRIGPFADTSR